MIDVQTQVFIGQTIHSLALGWAANPGGDVSFEIWKKSHQAMFVHDSVGTSVSAQISAQIRDDTTNR